MKYFVCFVVLGLILLSGCSASDDRDKYYTMNKWIFSPDNKETSIYENVKWDEDVEIGLFPTYEEARKECERLNKLHEESKKK